jgi:hypothetical protein
VLFPSITREAIRVIPEITRAIWQRGKSNSPPLNLPEPHSASPGNTENIPEATENSPVVAEYIPAGKSYGMITEDFSGPGITGHR